MPNRQRKASPAFTNLFSMIHHRMLAQAYGDIYYTAQAIARLQFCLLQRQQEKGECLFLLRQSVEHVETFFFRFSSAPTPPSVFGAGAGSF